MSEDEFAQVVRETKGVVLSAIRRHLGADFYHAIDDVAQETYLRAFRSLQKNSFRNEAALSSWLYRIAANESKRCTARLIREEQKSKKKLEADLRTGGQIASDETGDRMGPVETEQMRDLVARLPEKYRNVFNLQLDGLSEKEIAGRLNLSPGTIKSRSSRGRELMARMLKGGAII